MAMGFEPLIAALEDKGELTPTERLTLRMLKDRQARLEARCAEVAAERDRRRAAIDAEVRAGLLEELDAWLENQE